MRHAIERDGSALLEGLAWLGDCDDVEGEAPALREREELVNALLYSADEDLIWSEVVPVSLPNHRPAPSRRRRAH